MSARKAARSRGSTKRFPDLGRLDICLKVGSVQRSARFYETLGFRQVEGARGDGWCVLERGTVRIGLFHGYIRKNLLNFRGGDVEKIVEALEGARLKPYRVRLLEQAGAGNASVNDPDGNVIFFDTTPAEFARRRAARRRR